MALLGNQKWRLGNENQVLWKDVLESKYEKCRSPNNKKKARHESCWWRDITRLVRSKYNKTGSRGISIRELE